MHLLLPVSLGSFCLRISFFITSPERLLVGHDVISFQSSYSLRISSALMNSESDWEEKLQVTKSGVVISNYFNIELILNNDPHFKDK